MSYINLSMYMYYIYILLVFWPYSVFGQNHLCVMMRLIGIPLSEWCQKILPASQKNFKFPVSRPDNVSSRPDAHLSNVPSVRKMCHSLWTSDRQASSVRTTCFFRQDTYIVSRSFCPSLLRPDVSAARPDAYQFSNGSLILSKFKKGKINQPSGRVSP